jgi:Dolichyl-phosphate-mannose-protein mannosyltransferase
MATLRATSRAAGSWWWGATVAAVVLFAHIPEFAHRLLDGDEAIYASIAALMNTGRPLYADGGVDNKPPGIFWVYAATFHVAGNYQMDAVHAVGLLVIVATCACLFTIGRSLAGTRAGLLSALLYGVLTAAGNPRLLASNTELFMMLPLTASVLLMLRKRWLWSGALLVLAGAFKQVAAVNLLLAPVAIVLLEAREKRLRAAVLFAGGVVAALLLGAIGLQLTGSLAGFWNWTVGSLYGYAATQWTPALIWQRAQDSIAPFVTSMVVVWAAAVAFAWRWKRLPPAQRLVVGWLVVSVPGSLAGGHLSWHYFIQVMGPLALLAAFAIEKALETPRRRWLAGVAIVGVGAPLIAWAGFDLVSDPLTYDFRAPVPQHQAVAAYIRDHTQADDRVFVWGDWPALYIESDRLMASRFPGFLRGFSRGSGAPPNNWDTTAEVWPELQADLTRNPPALIIDTAPGNWSDFSMYPMSNYPVLADFVTRRYHVVATMDGVVIYGRTS